MTRVGYSNKERRGVVATESAFLELGMGFREQPILDFGIDAHVELIEDSKPSGKLFAVQIKTGPSKFSEATKNGWLFRFDRNHKIYWCKHALPVIVVLCDLDSKQLFWQRVATDIVESTGKQFKVEVPRNQQVNEYSRNAFIDLATRIPRRRSYTIIREEDSSHAGARRKAVYVLLSGEPNRPEVAAIAREVTQKHIGSDYYRDIRTESLWRGVDNQVVWTFFYPTLDDFEQSNCLCKTYWIDPGLDKDMRPAESGGQNVGLSVMMQWNENYELLVDLYTENEITKGEYLRITDQLVERLTAIVEELNTTFHSFNPMHEAFSIFARRHSRNREVISEIESERGKLGTPPVECADLHRQFQSLVDYGDNLRLYMSEDSSFSEKNAVKGVDMQLRSFERAFSTWQQERKKVAR